MDSFDCGCECFKYYGSVILSLNNLPADVIGKTEIDKYKIVLGKRYGSFVDATFPAGWSMIKKGNHWMIYVDPKGYPRFACFVRVTILEDYVYTKFYSDEYAEEEYKKMQNTI